MIDDIIKEIQNEFKINSNSKQALWYQNYMRNQFPFYGIQSSARRKMINHLIIQDFSVDELLLLIFKLVNGTYREEFYAAIDIFDYHYQKFSYQDIVKLYKLIEIKPWWDTIDALQKVFVKYDMFLEEMTEFFNQQELFWYRRMAIILQLKRKSQTNIELLKDVIIANQYNNEFFIQKAIGWVLREYSKTNSIWVKEFLKETQLSKLAIREASKYL